jgi:FKBP-type peptidyl-prolyl cis-trans isomerase (trigger factor)
MTTDTNTLATIPVTITKKDRSTVEIIGELSFAELEKHRAAAVARVSEHVKLDGFRPGHIPEAILLKEVGDMVVLEEMARMAISDAYPRIVLENTIDAIGHPEITITKIAAGSPLGFSITTAVMPIVTLPDYKKIAKNVNKKKETVTVSDEDVERTIADVVKHRHDDHVHDDTCDHNHDHDTAEPANTDEKPTELTDDIARSLGDFADATDLRAKVKENMLAEKERHATQTHRGALIDAIVAEMKTEVPDIVIDGELDRMMAQFENDIARMGLKFDAYLEHIKKTRDDLRTEWRPDGEKSAKTQLALSEIAKAEHISPNNERVDTETKNLMEQHPGTPEHHIRGYVEMVLANDAALAFLETQQ